MEQSATVAGRRLLLVGGEAAALLFAFAVLAARSMRRDLEAARRRLTWYGARRWQLRLLTVTESAIVAVAGALSAGSSASSSERWRRAAPARPWAPFSARAFSRRPGSRSRRASSCSRRSSSPSPPRCRPATRAASARSTSPLSARRRRRRRAARRRRRPVAARTRARTPASSCSSCPGLIAFAAAVAAARLFGPLVRLAGRLLHRSVGARLAAVTLGRGPGAAAVTVAFLTLAFALALLAEGYRATLVQAESDQASFAVPLDIVVREDLKSLIPVLDAAPLARYAGARGQGRRRCRSCGSAAAPGAPRDQRDHRARPARRRDGAAARLAERLLRRLARRRSSRR